MSISFDYPTQEIESEIVVSETGCKPELAKKLCALAQQIRSLDELTLRETVSTRLLIHAARLVQSGLNERLACEAGLVHALTDDEETTRALKDLCNLRF